MLKPKDKAMLASYGRSVIAALIAVYSTSNTDPADLGKAALAAIVPVLMRYVNPKDLGFGRGSTPQA
jgi:hypothetical protein